MNTLIIFHQVKPGTDCPDGVVAAAIAHRYHKDFGPVTIEGAFYRKEYPDLPDIEIPKGTTKITIVDFSYPAGWLNHWLDQGIDVEVLEHHADKFPWLSGFSGAVLDDRECGATIAWKHYYPDRSMPKILNHVRRRDIGLDGYYQGKATESEAINLGLGKLRSALKDLPIEEKLDRIADAVFGDERIIHGLAIQGAPEIEKRDRLIADRVPHSHLAELDGIVCAFYDFTNDQAIAPYYSLLGHRIAEHHGVELAWMVDGKNNHLRSTTDQIKIRSFAAFSLGSRLNQAMDRLQPPTYTNCAAIAQSYGGGGHPCASGWQG